MVDQVVNLFQSPSGSYLFSHSEEFFELKEIWEKFEVAIALKLLPVFTLWGNLAQFLSF